MSIGRCCLCRCYCCCCGKHFTLYCHYRTSPISIFHVFSLAAGVGSDALSFGALWGGWLGRRRLLFWFPLCWRIRPRTRLRRFVALLREFVWLCGISIVGNQFFACWLCCPAARRSTFNWRMPASLSATCCYEAGWENGDLRAGIRHGILNPEFLASTRRRECHLDFQAQVAPGARRLATQPGVGVGDLRGSIPDRWWGGPEGVASLLSLAPLGN